MPIGVNSATANSEATPGASSTAHRLDRTFLIGQPSFGGTENITCHFPTGSNVPMRKTLTVIGFSRLCTFNSPSTSSYSVAYSMRLVASDTQIWPQ